MAGITCTVAYPSTTTSGALTTFDMTYYIASHMPMIDRYWAPHGMRSWTISQFGPGLDGAPPPYIVQTTIHWDRLEDLKAALAAPESQETGADVKNFSTAYPVIWLGEVTGSKTL